MSTSSKKPVFMRIFASCVWDGSGLEPVNCASSVCFMPRGGPVDRPRGASGSYAAWSGTKKVKIKK